MPILDGIMGHEVLGRERKRGIEMRRDAGQRSVILRQIAVRFGKVPASAKNCRADLPYRMYMPPLTSITLPVM